MRRRNSKSWGFWSRQQENENEFEGLCRGINVFQWIGDSWLCLSCGICHVAEYGRSMSIIWQYLLSEGLSILVLERAEHQPSCLYWATAADSGIGPGKVWSDRTSWVTKPRVCGESVCKYAGPFLKRHYYKCTWNIFKSQLEPSVECSKGKVLQTFATLSCNFTTVSVEFKLCIAT